MEATLEHENIEKSLELKAKVFFSGRRTLNSLNFETIHIVPHGMNSSRSGMNPYPKQ
jgi:hypothetical protein